MKHVFEYEGNLIALPLGESLVGRARGCRLRFADLTVSRLHCRLVVSESKVTIDDLGSQSGTMVNDAWLQGSRELQDGDAIQVGGRRFWVREHGWREDREVTHTDVSEGVSTGATDVEELPTDLSLIAGVSGAPTISGRVASRGTSAARRRESAGVDPAESILLEPQGDSNRALQRKPTIPMYSGGTARERRRDVRVATEVQALYSSDELTFRGLVRDLSTGGMFIASDLLDPSGTTCRVDVFPEGRSTVRFAGVVRHVVQAAAGSGGRPPGVGIQFTDSAEDASEWLESFLTEGDG